MKHTRIFTTILLATAVIAACSEINPEAQIKAGAPIATGEATEITHNSATLWGFVNPKELETGVEIGIIVSTAETPSVENGSKYVSRELDKHNKFFVEARNLRTNTKYYYKAFLNVGGTFRVGDVMSFTTDFFKGAAVDLNLPSGLKWANCNVGATKPEEYGDYFAWGEIEPYYTDGHSQDNYCNNWKDGKSEGYGWSTYKWSNGSYSNLTNCTKYCTNSDYGIIDNKTILDLEDDAANANWRGTWRMPTAAEWTELRENCTWNWTSQGRVKGMLVTSNSNGNSIFLPAAGRRDGALLDRIGSYGYYWSSSLSTGYPDLAKSVYCSSGYVGSYGLNRYYGFSVRPVSE